MCRSRIIKEVASNRNERKVFFPSWRPLLVGYFMEHEFFLVNERRRTSFPFTKLTLMTAFVKWHSWNQSISETRRQSGPPSFQTCSSKKSIIALSAGLGTKQSHADVPNFLLVQEALPVTLFLPSFSDNCNHHVVTHRLFHVRCFYPSGP